MPVFRTSKTDMPDILGPAELKNVIFWGCLLPLPVAPRMRSHALQTDVYDNGASLTAGAASVNLMNNDSGKKLH